jgi:hypothetical protein
MVVMYIQKVPNRNSPPAVLLRESYREGDQVKKRGSSRLCVIIFAYGIVKCLLGNTFRTILWKKLSV